MINLLQQMGLTQSLSHYTPIPFPCKLTRSSGPHHHRERTSPDEDWTIHSTFSDATEDKFISPLIVLIHIQIHDFIHVNRLRLSDPSPNKQKESLIFGWENLTIYQESFDISPNNKFSVAKKKLFLEDQEIMIYNLMVLPVGLGGPTPCTAMISITKHLNSDDIKYISQILFQTGGWLTRFLPSPGLSRIDHESKMVMTPTMTTLSSVRREDQTIFSSLQQIISCERDLH